MNSFIYFLCLCPLRLAIIAEFNILKVAIVDRESAKRVVASKECLKALLPPTLLPCIS